MTKPAGTTMKLNGGDANVPLPVEPAKNKPNGGAAMANQHEKMVQAAKEVQQEQNTSPALNVSAEDKKRLQKAGVRPFYGELIHSEYTLSEAAQIADISGAWLRTCIKTEKVPATKKKVGNKELWKLTQATVAKLRKENVEKHLERLDRGDTGKKYVYRRPTEWAYHLTVKAIKSDPKLTKAMKTKFLDALSRYKIDWEKAYEERLAKKAANEAKKAAEAKK